MGKIRKSSATDDDIVAAYKRTKSAFAVGRELKVSPTTIYRVLLKRGIKRTGLELYRKNAKAFTPAQAQSIRKAYERGLNYRQLVAKFGGSEYSVKRAIRAAGGKLVWAARPAYEKEDARILKLHLAGMSGLQISIKLKRSQPFVSRRLRAMGRESATIRSGENHGMWKGGRTVTRQGYVRVVLPADDQFASMRGHDGYVAEHRIVLARKLGRPLEDHETVHHIDGDRTNNAEDNLQLRQGKHGIHVVMRCRACGSHDIEHAPIADPA